MGMDRPLDIRNLQGISLEQISQCFNGAFADYSVPMQVSAQQLHERLKSIGYAPEWSTGVFSGNELLAFVLHAKKTVNGEFLLYNGGTGSLPKARGKGLTKRQYEYLLPKLKDVACKSVCLEVIQDNLPAIRTYEKIGFSTSRQLACFQGQVDNPKKLSKAIVQVHKGLDESVIELFWDWRPSWQHAAEALLNAPEQLSTFKIMDQGNCIAYAIFQPSNAKVVQLAVAPDFRRQGYGSLLAHYIQRQHETPLKVINMDASSKGNQRFWDRLGLEFLLMQQEMVLTL